MTRRSFETRAAIEVQRISRGFLARRLVNRALAEFLEIAADIEADVQDIWRGYKSEINYTYSRRYFSIT